MRKIMSSTVAACAALLLLSPTAANAAPASRLKIEHKTGAIFQYDPSIAGTGPLYDAVTVYAQVRDCPAGNYVLHMDLIQDGVNYELASRANGVGEFSCSATEANPQLQMSFLGNGLHPGPAQVIATVYKSASGMTVLAESSRTVRIPAGYNQP